ncbi:uncharacterized protein SOCE26_048920 [Sorangium cellulosum]|uniref:Uncharacterized protein n=1 Tax=Sorangium cellulosum TaxID=56 RepID=A0A2L0EVY0_SORCE|nr:hypothetical protein [Sorangium cellulosum]AUX43444.1 uncharacterized protein SOCE26_048920 [Sorangium cellulosum]
MKRIRFVGQNITERERQIINALIDVHSKAMLSAFGINQATAGYTDEQTRMVLEMTKEFGEQYFPDVKFWSE